MKKIMCFIFVLFTSIICIKNIYSYASDQQINVDNLSRPVFFWFNIDSSWYLMGVKDNHSIRFPTSTSFEINNSGSDCYGYYSSTNSFNPLPPFKEGIINNYVFTYWGSIYSNYNVSAIVVVKGQLNINGDLNGFNLSYFNENQPWYLEAWDVFKDYMSGSPFHWIKSLGDFWKNRYTDLRGFWNNIFHKDINGNIQQDMVIISPTPLPPPPTPIQYSTFVEFDSNSGTYIYKYKYVDNNNVTIIATSPPEQPSSGPGSNENIKDDYYPEDPLDVPKDNGMWSPQFTINLGDGETLDIDLNTMNDTLIQGAEPYLDDIDASSDLFGAIPQDWFFLIGFCAIIPLICGIINRFLG